MEGRLAAEAEQHTNRQATDSLQWYLTGRVKGGEEGGPLHQGLRQDLTHVLPGNARQRSVISRVRPVAAL